MSETVEQIITRIQQENTRLRAQADRFTSEMARAVNDRGEAMERLASSERQKAEAHAAFAEAKRVYESNLATLNGTIERLTALGGARTEGAAIDRVLDAAIALDKSIPTTGELSSGTHLTLSLERVSNLRKAVAGLTVQRRTTRDLSGPSFRTTHRKGDQPAPAQHNPALPEAWPTVIAHATEVGIDQAIIGDMIARHKVGIERYGFALQPNNGRNQLRDLYEELLDAVAYATNYVLEERERVVASGLPIAPVRVLMMQDTGINSILRLIADAADAMSQGAR